MSAYSNPQPDAGAEAGTEAGTVAASSGAVTSTSCSTSAVNPAEGEEQAKGQHQHEQPRHNSSREDLPITSQHLQPNPTSPSALDTFTSTQDPYFESDPGPDPNPESNHDRDIDPIWADDDDEASPIYPSTRNPTASDLPLLRRTHLTSGYRSGISAGKADESTAQVGFDAGYPLGAALGMRVGRVIGGMRGLAGLGVDVGGGKGLVAEGDEKGQEVKDTALVERMERELGLEALMRSVQGVRGADEEVDLDDDPSEALGAEHEDYEMFDLNAIPALQKWEVVLAEMGRRVGVDFELSGG